MRVMLTYYMNMPYGPTTNPGHSILALKKINILLVIYGVFTETVLL